MSEAEHIKHIHDATGLGWIAAKEFIACHSEELVSRIIKAKEAQADRSLYDPLEDQPELKAIFEDVRRRAEEEMTRWASTHSDGLRKRPLGSCYVYWREMKRLLKEEHSLTWFTPAEMNPGSVFD